MSDKTIGRQLVDLVQAGSATKFEAEFDLELSTRISERLGTKRQEVAQQMMAKPLESEE